MWRSSIRAQIATRKWQRTAVREASWGESDSLERPHRNVGAGPQRGRMPERGGAINRSLCRVRPPRESPLREGRDAENRRP